MGCSASRSEIVLNKAFDGCASYFFPSRSRPLKSSVTANSSAVMSPKTRSLPAPVVHHPPTRRGDSHHLVSLVSTTYGSLILLDHQPPSTSADRHDFADQSYYSPSPDSVINAWELMEGLEDDDEEQNHRHSFDSVNKLPDSYPFVEITEEWSSNSENSNSMSLWKHLSKESLVSKLDSNSPCTYQRASSSRHFRVARAKISTRSMDSTPIVSRFGSATSSPQRSAQIPASEDKIVLYFTSLRSIRKTYSDCCAVRAIFRGLRVSVDERDVSMDSSYRMELKCALGGKSVSLPQVFIKRKHIGGADEIKQLNEDGELTKLIDGFPVSMVSGFVCRSCGDARFVPCCDCNGSRKVFEKGWRRRRCSRCNENGLIRCPACCS